ncbi:MAG: NlpC/P60 family protein, partial [Ilumatobacteraceae bacterium]
MIDGPHPLRRRAAVVFTAVLVSTVLAPSGVDAQSIDDQRREVERIVDELDRLHVKADTLAEDYAVAMDDQRRLSGDIALAEARVAEREAELSSLQGDLATVAVRAFTRSGTDVLGPLLSDAASYSDALQRDQYSRIALAVGAGTTDDLGETIRELGIERAELDRLRGESEELSVDISDKLTLVEEWTSAYEEAKDEAEARLGDLIEAEEQRRSQEAFERLQRELEAQRAAAAAAAAAGSTGGGSGGSSGGGSVAAPVIANYPAPSGLAGVAIQAALGQLGVPYRYAQASPGVAFDCSGLTYYAWAQAGITLPRNSRMQAAAIPRVPIAAAQPGDLIFYYSPISHVGIYLGNGQLVHAPNTGSSVKVTNVRWSKVVAVGRPG